MQEYPGPDSLRLASARLLLSAFLTIWRRDRVVIGWLTGSAASRSIASSVQFLSIPMALYCRRAACPCPSPALTEGLIPWEPLGGRNSWLWCYSSANATRSFEGPRAPTFYQVLPRFGSAMTRRISAHCGTGCVQNGPGSPFEAHKRQPPRSIGRRTARFRPDYVLKQTPRFRVGQARSRCPNKGKTTNVCLPADALVSQEPDTPRWGIAGKGSFLCSRQAPRFSQPEAIEMPSSPFTYSQTPAVVCRSY